jgi:hypothetical protein
MDKNIAAILREDAKTVQVTFPGNDKPYTYVTHLDVVPGDFVVVKAREALQVVCVKSVDADLAIEPNSDVRYAWIVAKVDMASHAENTARNEAIEKTLAETYRKNARQAFAQTLLAGAPEDQRAQLLALTGAKS